LAPSPWRGRPPRLRGREVFQEPAALAGHLRRVGQGPRCRAPVTFRGVPVGSVTDIKVVVDPATHQMHTPVVFEITADRLTTSHGGPASPLLRDRSYAPALFPARAACPAGSPELRDRPATHKPRLLPRGPAPAHVRRGGGDPEVPDDALDPARVHAGARACRPRRRRARPAHRLARHLEAGERAGSAHRARRGEHHPSRIHCPRTQHEPPYRRAGAHAQGRRRQFDPDAPGRPGPREPHRWAGRAGGGRHLQACGPSGAAGEHGDAPRPHPDPGRRPGDPAGISPRPPGRSGPRWSKRRRPWPPSRARSRNAPRSSTTSGPRCRTPPPPPAPCGCWLPSSNVTRMPCCSGNRREAE